MALSNPRRKVVEAIAGEALVHGDVVHLIMQQTDTSDARYSAVKYDTADADNVVPTIGVVDSGIAIASGDQVSCVVEGHCQAKVYYETVNQSIGLLLYVGDGATTAAADGTFTTAINHSDAATVVTDLSAANQMMAFVRYTRAQVLEATSVTAAAASRLSLVRVFNNPATPS